MGFYVHASNIHTDEMKRYGPFPGEPQLTYEFLRCTMPPLEGSHIFSYHEERQDAFFLRLDGEGVGSYGWRRCYDSAAAGQPGWGQFGLEHGPIWTDLSIVFDPDTDVLPYETNVIPQEVA